VHDELHHARMCPWDSQLCMAMDIFLAHLIQFRDTRSIQVDTLVRISMTYGLAFFMALASSPCGCEYYELTWPASKTTVHDHALVSCPLV
jgi:hypothetical protein